MTAPLPPAMPGLPLLGNLLEYRRDHLDVFWRAYTALGPIFSIRLGPQRAVVLVGPDYHRFFFTEVDKILSMPEVYRFVIPMFGPVLNAAADESVRKRQLALLHSAFQGDRMRGHLDVMVRETLAWLDSLGDSGSFELFEAFAGLGMNIAAATFMGNEMRARMPDFLPLYADLARGMEFVLPANLPLPRFRRRDQARRKLLELMRPLVAERRAYPGRHADFLETLLGMDDAASEASGGHQTDADTVVSLALLTVFTAYITTAAQSCWSLIQLLQHPEYLGAVEAEREAVLGDRPERFDLVAAGRLERLDWALKETQRMHPVMSHYARYNARGYELGGHAVPPGWLTMVCPAIAHRLPEVFARPDTYDPLRFSPERAEDRRPYSLVAFGAGLYRCPGASFGTNEMKCIVSLLLQRYALKLEDANPRRDYEMGVIRPGPPCRVRYTRRVQPQTSGRDGAELRVGGAPMKLGALAFSVASPGTADGALATPPTPLHKE